MPARSATNPPTARYATRYVATSPPRPPKASSRSACVSGLSRLWCSCCPCRSIVCEATSRSTSSVAGVSLMNARLPLAEISRRMTSIPPSDGSISRSTSRAGRRPSSALSNVPSMMAFFAPVRRASVLARSPSSRPSAPSRIDLPAPVSPVMMLSPLSNSTSSSSISA